MNKLHPHLEKFYNLILEIKSESLLSKPVLELLKHNDATATEAAIVLHMGFSIDLDHASDFVGSSKLFPNEEINDVAYQTFLYLYYDRG